LTDLYQVLKAQVYKPECQITSTSTNIHNSRSSITQVLQYGQWIVTAGTQIGRLIEFYSTETAKILKRWLWWYGGRILSFTGPPATYSIQGG